MVCAVELVASENGRNKEATSLIQTWDNIKRKINVRSWVLLLFPFLKLSYAFCMFPSDERGVSHYLLLIFFPALYAEGEINPREKMLRFTHRYYASVLVCHQISSIINFIPLCTAVESILKHNFPSRMFDQATGGIKIDSRRQLISRISLCRLLYCRCYDTQNK